MKKGLFISFMAALSIFMVGCENGGKTEGEKFLRHKFDAVDFVINVGEDFDEYLLQCFHISFSFKKGAHGPLR